MRTGFGGQDLQIVAFWKDLGYVETVWNGAGSSASIKTRTFIKTTLAFPFP